MKLQNLPPFDKNVLKKIALTMESFEIRILQLTRAVLPFYIKDHERIAVTWRLDLFVSSDVPMGKIYIHG